MDPNLLAAWAAVAAAVAAITAVVLDGRRSRFSLSVDLLLRLDDQFNSATLRAARRLSAEGLLAGNEPAQLDEVLNFFEMVGLLLRRSALDRRMVWQSFAYWVLGYCDAAEPYIAKQRAADHTVWTELEYLQQALVKEEKKHRGSRVVDTIRSQRPTFLQEESGI